MANLNRIILVGKLTADPEGRSTMGGTPMTKFRLAVDRYNNEADFIDVVVWDKLAEFCTQSCGKGQLVLVEGRIQVRTFNDQMGNKRWATEVVGRNVQVLEKALSKNVVLAKTEKKEEAIEDFDLASDLPF